VRSFETAVICAETAETFGSVGWGYTKTGDGVVTLLGATPTDVRAASASPGFETTRQAFYSGFFQLSLSGFTTGSSSLTTAQKTLMDSIDTKDLTRAILVGANDNSGGPEASPALSLKRAEAARDYLVGHGKVASSLIRVEGHGVEARVPNPPGTSVPANRRVDVHLQRGAETVKPANARLGSAAESKRLLQQNPRLTVDEAVDTIVRLDSTTGRVSTAEWSELSDMLGALDGWRAVDPTVPDLRQTYAAALKRIAGRAQVFSAPARPPFPKVGPISPEVDEALRKYEESKKRLEDLKRERDSALRRLDEEAGLMEEQ
jgi:outer membrane protein OmpA-like peptidoglycan-associated protein